MFTSSSPQGPCRTIGPVQNIREDISSIRHLIHTKSSLIFVQNHLAGTKYAHGYCGQNQSSRTFWRGPKCLWTFWTGPDVCSPWGPPGGAFSGIWCQLLLTEQTCWGWRRVQIYRVMQWEAFQSWMVCPSCPPTLAAHSSGPRVLLPGTGFRGTWVCLDPPRGQRPCVQHSHPVFLSPVTLPVGIPSTRWATAHVLLPIFSWFSLFSY